MVVLLGLETYRQAQQSASYVRPQPPPGQSTPKPKLADPCPAACERLRVCNDAQAGADCLAACQTQWLQGSADCIRQATCAEVPICFAGMASPTCDEVCQKVEECGLLLPQENCRGICETEWDADARQCMTESVCEDIPSTCLPAAEGDPCVSYCNRLSECGLVESGNQYECIESCLAVDDPNLRDCVSRIECEQIPDVCLAQNYDPVCLDVCQRLDRCDALGDLELADCPLVCFAQWEDELLACVIDHGCGEIGPVCFQETDPVCDEVCQKLVGCNLEDYYEDCVAVCTTDLSDEIRGCVLEQSCEEIGGACFGEQPNMCETACRKAVECGLDEDYQACFDLCNENYDPALIACIVAQPCESIAEQCLQ